MGWRKLKRNFQVAARSLDRQRTRAALSVMGVVCAVWAIFTMIGVGEGARREALAQIESLGMDNILIREKRLESAQKTAAAEALSYGLNTGDVERIRRGGPFALRVAALKELSVEAEDESGIKPPKVAAVNADYRHVYPLGLKWGRFISDEDSRLKNLVCVLGADLAGQEGKDAYFRIGNQEFKVVGVLARRGQGAAKNTAISTRDYDSMVFVPLGSVAEAGSGRMGGHEHGLGEITVRISSPDQLIAASRVIARILETSHNGVEDYSIIIPRELYEKARQARRNFNVILAAIAIVSLLAGGAGVMNIMLASVIERRREVGIRRATGASKADIAAQFLCESILLTFAGGVAGLLAGVLFLAALYYVSGLYVAVVWWAVALSLAISLLAGIFFGVHPAMKAARMDPMEALRN